MGRGREKTSENSEGRQYTSHWFSVLVVFLKTEEDIIQAGTE